MNYKQTMNNIHEIIEQAAKKTAERQEREIISNLVAAGQIEPQGLGSIIRTLQTMTLLADAGQQALIIANAATAAAIRRVVDRAIVEIIISSVVETGTTYMVTDESVKQSLLTGIERRGY